MSLHEELSKVTREYFARVEAALEACKPCALCNEPHTSGAFTYISGNPFHTACLRDVGRYYG